MKYNTLFFAIAGGSALLFALVFSGCAKVRGTNDNIATLEAAQTDILPLESLIIERESLDQIGEDIVVLHQNAQGVRIAVGQRAFYVSSNNRKAWEKIQSGTGFLRTTVDGGLTFSGDTTSPREIDFDRMCRIENSLLTESGRFYALTICGHIAQLWSLPTTDVRSFWYVTEFLYKSDPSDGVFAPRPYLRTLRNKPLMSATTEKGSVLLTSNDDGGSWEEFYSSVSRDIRIVDFDVIGGTTVHILTSDGNLQSVDGSHTEVLARLPLSQIKNVKGMAFLNSSTGYLFGEGAEVYATKDGGRKWSTYKLEGVTKWYKALKMKDGTIWLSGNSDEVLAIIVGSSSPRFAQRKLGLSDNIYFRMTIFDNAPTIVSQGEQFRLSFSTK
jgi:hypothetical protein